MDKKLTTREIEALKDIRKYNGKYPLYWTTKTREKLVQRGLAEVASNLVTITPAGRAALDEHAVAAMAAAAI